MHAPSQLEFVRAVVARPKRPAGHGPPHAFEDSPEEPYLPHAQRPSQLALVRTVVASPKKPAAHFAVHVLTERPVLSP